MKPKQIVKQWIKFFNEVNAQKIAELTIAELH